MYHYAIDQQVGNLCKRPGFVIGVVTTLGLTMGALIAVLTLGYLVLFKPLPYPDQDRLVVLNYKIFNTDATPFSSGFIHPAAESLYKNHCNLAFTECALLFYDREVLASDSLQRTAATTYVTPEWFSLFAPKMAMGRVLSPDEGFGQDRPVAVLSYQAWQNFFGGREDVLEQSVHIAGTNFNIVGVTAESFSEPTINLNNEHTDIWLPWYFNGSPLRDNWGNSDYGIRFFGKMKFDINENQAAIILAPMSELDFATNVNSLPRFSGWFMELDARLLKSVISTGKTKPVYLLLLGVIGLLIIAVVNITNLFMARTVEKHRQLAIKAALGARKNHLRSEFFVETFLLLSFAALVALGVAHLCFIVMKAYFSELLPRLSELRLNYISIASAILLVWVLSIIFVYVCSSLIDYRKLNSALQSSGKGTGAQVSKRARNWLIASQVAVATVLTFSNLTLFGNAVERIERPTGFNTKGMINLQLDLLSEIPEQAPVLLEFEQAILQLPQIESMSFGNSPLLSPFNWSAIDPQSNQQFSPVGIRIDHRYFELLGIPLIAGTSFSREQLVPESYVIVINQTFAQQLSANESVIGRALHFGENAFVIIGVVDDVYMPGSDERVSRVYAPADRARFWMMLQLKENQIITRQQVVDVLKSIDSRLAISSLNSLSEIRERLLFAEYVTAITTAALAFLTILLAGIGLYGVLSYSTQMRSTEISVRRAIGAKYNVILVNVLRDYSGAFIRGLLAGTIFLIALLLFFKATLWEFLNFHLVWVAFATAFLVGATAIFATCMPLRPMLLAPVIDGLRGKD